MKKIVLITLLLFSLCLSAGCAKHNEINSHEVQSENGDVWLYLESPNYKNEVLGLSIDFPESWINELVIVEKDSSFQVHFRKALEHEPSLAPLGTAIFVFQKVNKTDEHIIKDLESNPSVSIFEETDDSIYYITELIGSIEIYNSDIWEESRVLLEEMRASIESNIYDLINITNEWSCQK